MSVTYFTLLTTIGESALAAATAQGSTLCLIHMAVGDGNGELPPPDTQQTRLVNERRRAPLNTLSVDPNNANQIIAEQVLPEDIGGWWIREIGLYDEHDRLIAVGNCPPTYKPQLTEGSGRTQIIRMVLIVSNTANVELKIDPSVVLATRQYVDEAITVDAQSRIHPDATITTKGFTQLSNATNSVSETLAATPKAVKAVYALANGKYTAQDATTTRKGIVQLSSETNSLSETLAATSKAVKETYYEATRSASTTQKGQVQLNDDVDSTSTTQAATTNAVRKAYDGVDSTSTTQAATANAVKKAYHKAKDAALPIGVPLPWPSTSIPSGWIKCAGQSFSTSSYPELAKAYPSGLLPDLRGEFIRGWDDDGRGADPDRNILTAQNDAIRNIVGTLFYGVDADAFINQSYYDGALYYNTDSLVYDTENSLSAVNHASTRGIH